MSRSYKRPDHYARLAKHEGKAARSIYKLEEIDKRWRLIATGARVLDLGCAPGSWTQYAANKVGSTGAIVGLDVQPVRITLPSQVKILQHDIYQLDAAALGTSFDVVLSDMAPSTMGDHTTDALRSAALAEAALAIADRVLKPRG